MGVEGKRDGGARVPDATLDVVIVTAPGARPHIGPCLLSLEALPVTAGRSEVVVVDNASSDGTIELVRARFPEVRVVELGANRGFSVANNVGIAAGRGPAVLILNPDTEVPPGTLDTLLADLAAHPQAAAVGPRLVDRAGRVDHNAKRRFPSPLAALRHFGGLKGGGYAMVELEEHESGPVDAVSGACMLVRRTAIDAVGGFDEGYWMYGEDLDWCARFRAAGWEVRYVGAATVLHVKHGVTGPVRPLRVEWAFHRSMGRFYRIHQAGRRPIVDAVVYLAVLGKFGAALLKRRRHRSRA